MSPLLKYMSRLLEYMSPFLKYYSQLLELCVFISPNLLPPLPGKGPVLWPVSFKLDINQCFISALARPTTVEYTELLQGVFTLAPRTRPKFVIVSLKSFNAIFVGIVVVECGKCGNYVQYSTLYGRPSNRLKAQWLTCTLVFVSRHWLGWSELSLFCFPYAVATNMVSVLK